MTNVWLKTALFAAACLLIAAAIRPSVSALPGNGVHDPNPVRFDPQQRARMEQAMAVPQTSLAYERPYIAPFPL